MSGGTYRGHRGGGKGKPRNNRNASKEVKKNKTIDDYFFYVGSNKQASDFETTSEFLINHVKKTFDRGNDVAEALRTLIKEDTDVWKPSLKFSTQVDTGDKAQENRQYELEYKADLDEYIKRKRMFDSNLFKAYALIWERCAKAMQNKIVARTDYENQIYNDPIELLKAVKEHALNYEESRYEMSIISDAFRAIFSVNQKETESLQDYTKRFKTTREILESHIGGHLVLTKFVQMMPAYVAADSDKVSACVQEASEQLFAFLYMENADQDKYGSLLQGLSSQKSLGHDQYPKTLSEANSVLSNHKFDEKSKNRQHERTQRARPKGDDENSNDEAPVLSFAQMEGKCYCCGKKGHKSPECYHKEKIPREEWAINKAQSLAQANTDAQSSVGSEGSSSTTTSTSTTDTTKKEVTPSVGWAGVHCSFAQTFNLKKLILLDSDSTDTVFCNPDYVTNIRETDQSLNMVTNGGPLNCNQKCTLPHLGECWFNKDSITNIIALSDMTAKFRVTMDSTAEKAMLIHLPDKVIKFWQMPNGLYAMDPTDPHRNNSSSENLQMIQTVAENLKFLTPRQQQRARRARELFHAIGTPSIDDLKAMIRMNLIRNNIVSTEDINLATKAYGDDIGQIKGKTTRKRPSPVVSNLVEIPDELLDVQKDVILSIDGMTVNSLKFLTTISHELFYRTA
jgi:hypothetical protein